MPPKQSLWFRLGFALERARQGPPAVARSLDGLAARQAKPSNAEGESGRVLAWPSIDDIVASGATAVVAKMLNGWKPRRKTATLRLLRAGAAGAGAALMVDVLRPLLRGESGVGPLDRETGDRLVKGALYGTAEYAVDPVGGLSRLLGAHAPQHRLPLIGYLLEDLDPHDRVYVEHVIFGVALALLYGSSPSSNGIRIDVDDE